ncbi:PREDICTED: la-related protein 1-like, partial [Vollenhovia emeryi]|uniref:la-related protein 1-like n=1 Tax=Vollenhovia emeryi TaxID=411798 RepID=UPI0005F47FDF
MMPVTVTTATAVTTPATTPSVFTLNSNELSTIIANAIRASRRGGRGRGRGGRGRGRGRGGRGRGQ